MKRSVAFPILALLVIAIAAVANYAVYQAGLEWFVQKPSLLVVVRNVAAVAAVIFGGWLLLPAGGRKRSAETLLLVAGTLFGIGLAVQFRLGHDAPRQMSNDQIVELRDSVRRSMPGATEDSLRRAVSRLVRSRNGALRRDFDASRIDTRLARSLERAYGPTADTRKILEERETAPSDSPLFRFLPVLAALLTVGAVARMNLATILSARWRIAGLYGSIAVCVLTLGYLISTGGVRGANFAPQELLKVTLPVAWAGLLIHYRGAFLSESRERFTRSPLVLWLYVLLHSEGQLARHLDPGGTYRLARWIEIERDFADYFRIASTMLQPGRLHEIAAASSASMADVFDVVNAYDAIGLIEWQPRSPRGGEPVEEPNKGLLGRLRKSLKRS